MIGDSRAGIIACCQRLDRLGLNAGADGNVSVRVGPDRVLVTPSGGLKANLVVEDLVEVDLNGKRIAGARQPTSELALHLSIMSRRPEVGAVIHAHPPTATGFNLAGQEIDSGLLPELAVLVGEVGTVPFALPGSQELGDRISPVIARHDVCLLDHHGAVAVGTTLEEAQIRLETLEHAAKMILVARLLGSPEPLSSSDRSRLESLRAARLA